MEWSENWRYASRGIESSLELLRANRRHIVELIRHIPGACDKSIRLQRPNKLEVRITVVDVLEIHTQHMVEHVENIQAIRQAHSV